MSNLQPYYHFKLDFQKVDQRILSADTELNSKSYRYTGYIHVKVSKSYDIARQFECQYAWKPRAITRPYQSFVTIFILLNIYNGVFSQTIANAIVSYKCLQWTRFSKVTFSLINPSYNEKLWLNWRIMMSFSGFWILHWGIRLVIPRACAILD